MLFGVSPETPNINNRGGLQCLIYLVCVYTLCEYEIKTELHYRDNRHDFCFAVPAEGAASFESSGKDDTGEHADSGSPV